MRKFILNLITVLAWVCQIISWFTIVFSPFIIGLIIYAKNSPELRQAALEGMGIKAAMQARYAGGLDWLIWMFILGTFAMIVMIMICRYVKKLVKNIKAEVYFANENVKWIRNLLIWTAINVVINIAGYIINKAWYAKYALLFENISVQNYIAPNGVFSGILFVVVFYLIYIVFKYGVQLQQTSDEII